MDVMESIQRIKAGIAQKIIGKDDTVELILAAFLSQGHVLLEDVPGVGKTTLVKTLAQVLGLSFKRIQFTPDVLPSDVTGFNVYDAVTGKKSFVQGAVMSQIVLADEINRTSPKTQSSLLEAMQEKQVTVDGETMALPTPFMVLATQNPVGLVGTYPLPEAQLDRFLIRVEMGYPTMKEELEILHRNRDEESTAAEPSAVLNAESLMQLLNAPQSVTLAPAVEEYIVKLVRASREHKDVELGASPRAAIALEKMARALAVLRGEDFVRPEDVRRAAQPVLAHRLVLAAQAAYQGVTDKKVVEGIVSSQPVPALK